MATQKVQITIANVNDGIVTGPQPTNPVNGELWLDSSVTPNPMLKEWNGTGWDNKGEMDATLSTSLDNINTSLNNMTDDSKIDFTERKTVKQYVSNIIGYVIADTTTTLPTQNTLDTSGAGSFYSVRRSALNAGVSAQNADYTSLATAYSDLATYLQGLAPLPWDAGLPNRSSVITVDPPTFRQKWVNYYAAEDVLRTTTATQLQQNVTNINIGGRNLLLNTGLTNDATSFTLDTGVTFDNTFQDGQYNTLKYNLSGLAVDTYSSAQPDKVNAKVGDIFSASVDVYIPTGHGIAVGVPTLEIQFFNASGTKISAINQPTGLASLSTLDKWQTLYMENVVAPANTATVNARVWLQRNGKLWVAKLKLENGTKRTAWTPAPEDADGQITELDTRISKAETTIQPDNITNTVLSSTNYTQQMSQKVDQTTLGNYATSDQLTQAQASAQSYADQQIKAIDYSPYVTQSQLTQNTNTINAKFSAGGGVNLVKNSVGFANTDMWTVTGSVTTVQTDELTQLGFMSGFADNGAVSGSIAQTIYTIVGQYYTLSFYMKKDVDATTNAYLGIYLYDANNTQIKFTGIDTNMGKTTGYQQFTYTWLANTATYTLTPSFGANTSGVITGIMANIGYDPLQWSMATGELYNSNIKMDLNGITVSQTLNGIETGRTVMTPTKFAGYYDVNNDGTIDETTGSPDEVFRVDKDEFVMKKANISQEITLSTLKIILVNSGSTNGIAFVKNT